MNTPLSADTLLAQGACCGNGCLNCPFRDEHGSRHHKGSLLVAPEWQKWVLFDFDGTLADTLPLQKEAYAELSRRHGWGEITEADFRKLRKLSLKDAIRERKIPLWRVPFLLQEGQQVLLERWSEATVFAGIPELLQALQAEGFQLGIVTSNSGYAVDTILTRAGVRDSFTFLIAEPHLWGKSKRLTALVRKHDWNPNRIWYVGDEVRDMDAAQAAGLRCVGVTWGLNEAETLAATGAPIVDTPQNLLHWIQTHQPN